MEKLCYIQVLLPLRLEWEPYYLVPEEVTVREGDHVHVEFAFKDYVAVVTAVDVHPREELVSRILYIKSREAGLPPVLPQEIRFWRTLADYYLCTAGEVYKAACAVRERPPVDVPAAVGKEGAPVRLSPSQALCAEACRKAFEAGRPVLLQGSERTEIYLRLALQTLSEGRSVLILVPEITLSRQLEERIRAVVPQALVYHSGQTPRRRALVASALGGETPYLVLGTRSALFLPHRGLGLIVVDEEHDHSYKQDSPAPRYHARESAIMLSLIHFAAVVLGSATPSLESVYNAQNSRFAKVELKESFSSGNSTGIEVIDTSREYRKNGMAGSFSLKLLARMREVLDAGKQVLLLGPRRSSAEGKKLQEDAQACFPDARIGFLDQAKEAGEANIIIGGTYLAKAFQARDLGLVATLAADSILARQDFRADERAVQEIELLRGRCPRVVIQTREASHPVFSRLAAGEDVVGPMLEERRIAGLPPFTRLVHLTLKDTDAARVDALSKELSATIPLAHVGPYTPATERVPGRHVRQIRIMLPRDKALQERKRQLRALVAGFERTHKTSGHIALDVDPA